VRLWDTSCSNAATYPELAQPHSHSKTVVKSERPARLSWYATVALLAMVGGWGAFKAWPLLYPKREIHAVIDPDCDLRAGPCATALDDARSVRFSIEPRSIPPLSPLLLRVDAIGFTAQEVSVDLNGVGMHMGFNRVPLSKHPEGHFAGIGSLSVCIRDVMEWEAVIALASEDALISVPFRFITVKNGVRP